MISWCLMAFINFTSLFCQHVGWYKLKQSHNYAKMCSVVESHRRFIGGRYSNQMALSALSPLRLFLCRELRKILGWAVTPNLRGFREAYAVLYLSCLLLSKINEECRSFSFHLFSASTFLSIVRPATSLNFPNRCFTASKDIMAQLALMYPWNATSQIGRAHV